MTYNQANDPQAVTIWDLEQSNTDISVTPHVMVRGGMGKDTGGTWRYVRVSSSGALSNDDAANFRISSIGGTSSPLSADSSTISALQGDAAKLRVSSFMDSGSVSAKQSDAGNFRVSAIIDNGSVSAKSSDATNFRVSSVGGSLGSDGSAPPGSETRVGFDDGSVMRGARVFDVDSGVGTEFVLGTNLRKSASGGSVELGNDAGLFRISARSDDSGLFRVSALVDNGSVSAKSSDAGTFRMSAIGTITVSSHEVKQSDAASLLISAKSGDANQFHISSLQGDAGLLRISADMFSDTTGSLTVYRTLNASASQAIKATAGALYGYYIWNSDTKYNYLKFYNTSGAINIGTDTPILTIGIPPSAAANVEYAHGIKGFTTGIGIAALSAAADNATTASPASAIGANVFYT